MKPILLSMLAAAVVMLPATRSFAEDEAGTKPVAVLTIASYERLMTDIAFIGNLAGSPDLDKNLEGMIQLFTQGQGLAGLDKKRPLGVTLATDGVQFQPLIVLPVTDLQALLAALEGLVGAAQDAGDGIFELDVFNQKIFVKEHNTWAYLSTSPEVLGSLPKDGGELFGGLEKNYDVAGRLYVQNVPEVFRTMLIDQLRAGVEQGLARQEGETDEAFETRRKLVESQIDSLTSAINELEQLTLGLALNPDAKTAQLDLSFVALEGTDSAKQFAKSKPTTTSSFAGFLKPDAAATLGLTTELDESDAKQFVSGLDALRTQALEHIQGEARLQDEASKKLAAEMVNQVFDAIKATLESGKVDAGATLEMSEDRLALAVGAYVADTKSLDEALRKFVKLMANEPNFPEVKFDAETHEGIHFHTAGIPVPQDQKIAKVLGEKLDVAVGIGEKSVYLALGTDSLNLVKKLIDASKSEASKQVPPFQVNVSLGPVFQFASALQEDGDEENTVKALAEDLAKTPGKDHVRLEYIPQKTGATLRLSAEEGVLQLLGTLLKNAQASGALPGLGP